MRSLVLMATPRPTSSTTSRSIHRSSTLTKEGGSHRTGALVPETDHRLLVTDGTSVTTSAMVGIMAATAVAMVVATTGPAIVTRAEAAPPRPL